jgi:glucose-1-phosphate thymidylyltransferase
MWGIVPAAGGGSRIQPLAFSKELLPVGSRAEGGVERPRAVGEYIVERMIAGGATKLCFVIAPGKSDIMSYFGTSVDGVPICYVVQSRPGGLCDAVFRAAPFIDRGEPVVVGLPDTIWFPVNALAAVPDDTLAFLLFPVDNPSLFDVVLTAPDGRVTAIQTKSAEPGGSWVWGSFKMSGPVYHELHALWQQPDRRDEYFGPLVNAWLAQGGKATGLRGGESYVDVGTLDGYRSAMRILGDTLTSEPVSNSPTAPTD